MNLFPYLKLPETTTIDTRLTRLKDEGRTITDPPCQATLRLWVAAALWSLNPDQAKRFALLLAFSLGNLDWFTPDNSRLTKQTALFSWPGF
jgi:hypothetical protein